MPLAQPFSDTASDAPADLRLHAAGDPQRDEVEAFIRTVYARRFGARLRSFAPQLVSLHDADGSVVAAAGYRGARSHPLFLERYLGEPVETALARHTGNPPERAGIVEVGHLAAARPGEGRRLILQLGPLLADQGFQWVVSTLTEELRHLFVRIGVTPLALGAADPAALGAEAADWGHYYSHHPVVLAGHLRLALRSLARRRGGVPS